VSKNYESRIPEVKNLLSQKEEDALWLIGELLEGAAKLLAPVGLSGELRNKISHRVYARGEEAGVAVGTDIEYGIYVEKGTGIYAVDGNGRKTPWIYYDPLSGEYHWTQGMKPQPFLEPAAMKNLEQIKKIVEKVLKELDNN
jgi:HK97 gp10 family phage protein